jgi:uncharacterized membrane protein YgcG
MTEAEAPRLLWRHIDWDAVLDGDVTAPFYYMRSGLVRKDVLIPYAAEDAPPAFVVTSVAQCMDVVTSDAGAEADPATGPAASSRDRAWVLKKAASSCADGILFFTTLQVLRGEPAVVHRIVAALEPPAPTTGALEPPAPSAGACGSSGAGDSGGGSGGGSGGVSGGGSGGGSGGEGKDSASNAVTVTGC